MRAKLKGHESRITGLAFSENLNVLVSSGMDAQVHILIFMKLPRSSDSSFKIKFNTETNVML